MNRLVIIGNGFDLAHGLPTGYCDFIDDYWRNVVSGIGYNFLVSGFFIHEDNLIKTSLNFSLYDYYERQNLIKEYNLNSYSDFKNFKLKYDCDEKTKHHVGFKNNFFEIINERNSQNWVDIENEYYYQLKKIVKSKCLDISKSEEYWKEEQGKQVKRLNDEFDLIKVLFEKYLFEKVENSFDINKKVKGDNNWTNFYNILKPISIFNNEHNLKLEFNDINDRNEIDIFFIKEQQKSHLNKTQIRLLNFNYTSTLNKYIAALEQGEIKIELNQIHGAINNERNKINFGFGDEMDDDYKIIENINDNEYLRNFKSFQYLQNSNYSNLLSYIDSEKFQVLIMGHSCGLSDRTLLNTIFEHNNCRSIKVFYHQKEDGTDNYTEITQNISRHFNKKKLMREKIVNKTLCKPLPQIQLPKREKTTIFNIKNDPQP